MNELTLLEREILKSSHDDGMIPFPQGRFLEVERRFRTLENLARRGYVEYVRKTWHRAYWLTEKGWWTACSGREDQCEAPIKPAV